MGKTATYTYEQLMASFKESREESKRFRQELAKASAERRRESAESRRARAESRREWREIKRLSRESDRQMQETKKVVEETSRKVREVSIQLGGISSSNGMYAEEYFFDSLEKKMEFAGIKFDDISKDFKLLRKTPDGKRVEDQFDIVMLNGNTVALIEIKYKARKDDPVEMVDQKVSNFRFLFPEYAKHKIYLGLAGFSFEKSAVKKAKELGIGLLKQVGETVECKTSWVKAY
ncbi:MAG: hypothetical protein LBC64_05220 [Fibromonadaceae bacterium]|jgi:ElaB/YqjD/DUF883 family membrane-anchored ribosome-binding protein|nr:hypothetical protein [Fibromonadaceae bacterium]